MAPTYNFTQNKDKYSQHLQGEDSQSQLSQNALTKVPSYYLNSVHPSTQRSKQ